MPLCSRHVVIPVKDAPFASKQRLVKLQDYYLPWELEREIQTARERLRSLSRRVPHITGSKPMRDGDMSLGSRGKAPYSYPSKACISPAFESPKGLELISAGNILEATTRRLRGVGSVVGSLLGGLFSGLSSRPPNVPLF